MDIVEIIHELAMQEPTELQKEIEKAELEYKEIFGDNNYTNIFDDDETYLRKLKDCIKYKTAYNDWYENKRRKGEFI